MIKTTNILALCGIVLILACGAAADQSLFFSRSESIPIPQGGDGITYAFRSSMMPANMLVTSVFASVSVENANGVDDFWGSDYEVYVGNSARGASAPLLVM